MLKYCLVKLDGFIHLRNISYLPLESNTEVDLPKPGEILDGEGGAAAPGGEKALLPGGDEVACLSRRAPLCRF
jgi:hypothetical protein